MAFHGISSQQSAISAMTHAIGETRISYCKMIYVKPGPLSVDEDRRSKSWCILSKMDTYFAGLRVVPGQSSGAMSNVWHVGLYLSCTCNCVTSRSRICRFSDMLVEIYLGLYIVARLMSAGLKSINWWRFHIADCTICICCGAGLCWQAGLETWTTCAGRWLRHRWRLLSDGSAV